MYKFKVIIIENEPLYRLGLNQFLSSFAQFSILAEFDNTTNILSALSPAVNLIILSLTLDTPDLSLCRQIKRLYPSLPILLLTPPPTSEQFLLFQTVNINGYYIKGSSIDQLITVLNSITNLNLFDSTHFLTPIISPGISLIQHTLNHLESQLSHPLLSPIDRLIFKGRKRELKTALWLISHFLPKNNNLFLPGNTLSSNEQITPGNNLVLLPSESEFENLFNYGFENQTKLLLEIDILTLDKKRELFNLILTKFQNSLEQLRFSQIKPEQIYNKKTAILQDIWQGVVSEYFGKYYTIKSNNKELEIVEIILKDTEMIKEYFLDKIPFVIELFTYLLFDNFLLIDNISYSKDTIEAKQRIRIILQNLIITMANGVVQPLLNNFVDLEIIKQNFYQPELSSYRTITKLRNNLSWQYSLQKYILEPTAIFESKYNLIICSEKGLIITCIYASRSGELKQLKGVQLLVTLILEIRDAIAPTFKSFITFTGKGIVFLLTQIIGKGIGLIGKGILQGIGNSFKY